MHRKGQSAIEYLATYGWMLGVVAIAGAAIFATVQGQCTQSSSGFTGQDVIVENFGHGEDGLSLEIRNGDASTVEIKEISVSREEASRNITDTTEIDVGESKVRELASFTESDGCNTFNVDIVYDSGSIQNSTVDGTITGNIEIGSVPVPDAPTDPEVTI